MQNGRNSLYSRCAFLGHLGAHSGPFFTLLGRFFGPVGALCGPFSYNYLFCCVSYILYSAFQFFTHLGTLFGPVGALCGASFWNYFLWRILYFVFSFSMRPPFLTMYWTFFFQPRSIVPHVSESALQTRIASISNVPGHGRPHALEAVQYTLTIQFRSCQKMVGAHLGTRNYAPCCMMQRFCNRRRSGMEGT